MEGVNGKNLTLDEVYSDFGHKISFFFQFSFVRGQIEFWETYLWRDAIELKEPESDLNSVFKNIALL